jgi:DNA-binding response OmpR family regulator
MLITEDARDVANVIAFGARMTWPGCQVTIAENGNEALQVFTKQGADLVILDISIPPPDGFEVCRQIREISPVPILMLSVRDATLDKVRALDLGADDYLTKPFDHLELLARLRALTRRAYGGLGTQVGPITTQDVSLDAQTHEVRVADRVIRLTYTEFRLLEELMKHAGMVLTHQVLLERVWGPEYTGDASYLKVFVRRLRYKLGDDADNPRYIQTVWGIGYRFLLIS